jgi:hypothetical protein
MGSKLALAVLTASMLAPAWALPLKAQRRPASLIVVPPLTALALNDLTFGSVLPGIPSVVSVHDAYHAGLFEIQGPAGASVRVELVLPVALISDEGVALAVSFGHADGSAEFGGHSLPFDPHAPVIAALGSDGRLFIRLGGTALPGRPQAGGSYRATISLTVFNLGS